LGLDHREDALRPVIAQYSIWREDVIRLYVGIFVAAESRSSAKEQHLKARETKPLIFGGQA
jgi:hypothetical protein